MNSEPGRWHLESFPFRHYPHLVPGCRHFLSDALSLVGMEELSSLPSSEDTGITPLNNSPVIRFPSSNNFLFKQTSLDKNNQPAYVKKEKKEKKFCASDILLLALVLKTKVSRL